MGQRHRMRMVHVRAVLELIIAISAAFSVAGLSDLYRTGEHSVMLIATLHLYVFNLSLPVV